MRGRVALSGEGAEGCIMCLGGAVLASERAGLEVDGVGWQELVCCAAWIVEAAFRIESMMVVMTEMSKVAVDWSIVLGFRAGFSL